MLPKSLNTEQNRSEFRIAIDEAVTIQLKLDLFSWASLLYLIFEFYLDADFRPICDYTSLDRKCFLTWEHVLRQSGLVVLLTDSLVYV